MAEIKTEVFTASIGNQEAIEQWLEKVHDDVNNADRALAQLRDTLRGTPHVVITLKVDGVPDAAI